MALLLVTYGLNGSDKDYSGFHDAIEIYPHITLSESSYAIYTYETPSTLFNQLSLHMEASDHLYIMTLMRPWQGYGPEKVIEWLESHL